MMEQVSQQRFDFAPYLDIVNKSGDRTRNLIYVLIVINFCVFAAFLNCVKPNWGDLYTSLTQP